MSEIATYVLIAALTPVWVAFLIAEGLKSYRQLRQPAQESARVRL